MTYWKMEHRGGLPEAVMTSMQISQDEFLALLPNYKRYSFDKRINGFRYILRDSKLVGSLTFWLVECNEDILRLRVI